MIKHPLRKASLLLVTAIILMFLVAAGVEEAGINLAESFSLSASTLSHHNMIIGGLVSAWLFTVGLMCRKLEKIPGVRKREL